MQHVSTTRLTFDTAVRSNQSYEVKRLIKHPELGTYTYSLFCKNEEREDEQ